MASVAVVAAVIAAAVALAPAPTRRSRWRRLREDRRVGDELPVLLDEVARSMRAGLSVAGGLAASRGSIRGPLARDVDVLIAAVGGSSAALDDWARHRAAVPGVRLVVVALATAGQTGAAARAIDGVADTLRAEREVAGEVRAMASQAQVSALLIAVLPVVFAAVAAAADPSTVRFLVVSPVGRLCLMAGLLLDLGALVWMRRIVGSIR